MARELFQIMADPQPGECVRFAGDVCFRVRARDPKSVTYQRTAPWDPATTHTLSIEAWAAAVRNGTPCQPTT